MPTYSEAAITFTTDFQIGDVITLISTTNTYVTEFVASRSGAGEVTVGTPTATAGERTAINYEAAFDLDNATGYITTQTTNTVTIQSEDIDETFIAIVSATGNVGTFTVSFNNYEAPIDTTNVGLALVRSPHYVSTSFALITTTKVTISLYVWSGDLDDIPASPTFVQTRLRPIIDAVTLDTNLSELIRSNLNPTPNIVTTDPSQVIDSNTDAVKWIHYVAEFTDPRADIADVVGTFSALDGFGYYNQNANPTKPTNRILVSNLGNKKIATNGLILIPFVNDGTYTSVDVDTETGDINENFVITTDLDNAKFVQYVCIDPSQTTDRLVTVTFNGDTDVVLTINLVDECRYNPKTIVFKNKYGAYETLSMFKKSTSTIEVKKDEFVNQFVTNLSYDTSRHQFRNINIEATEKISLNTGYISESENESYKQMMLSDQVWFWEDGDLIPVNVVKNSLEFKTRVNDKLVNYTMEFKYSYNTIQNV